MLNWREKGQLDSIAFSVIFCFIFIVVMCKSAVLNILEKGQLDGTAVVCVYGQLGEITVVSLLLLITRGYFSLFLSGQIYIGVGHLISGQFSQGLVTILCEHLQLVSA